MFYHFNPEKLRAIYTESNHIFMFCLQLSQQAELTRPLCLNLSWTAESTSWPDLWKKLSSFFAQFSINLFTQVFSILIKGWEHGQDKL